MFTCFSAQADRTVSENNIAQSESRISSSEVRIAVYEEKGLDNLTDKEVDIIQAEQQKIGRAEEITSQLFDDIREKVGGNEQE